MWSPSGGREIEQLHNDFKNNRHNMIERMDKMHEQMFKGFGKFYSVILCFEKEFWKKKLQFEGS